MESLVDITRAGASAFAVGAGPAAAAVTLAVSPVARGYAEVVVANAAVTLASVILSHLLGSKDAENDLEEIADGNMQIFAIAEAGQIRFVLTSLSFFSGDFRVGYTIS